MSVKSEKTLLFKSVITGVLITVALIAVLMCVLCAVFLGTSKMPYEYLEYILLAIDAAAVFIGALIAARIARYGGLIIGASTGALVFIALFISGILSSADTLTLTTLFRAVILLLFGMLGGIRGVNRKDKIKIK